MRIGLTVETDVSTTDVVLSLDDAASLEAAAGALQEATRVVCRPLAWYPRPGLRPRPDDGTVAGAGWRHGMRLGAAGYQWAAPSPTQSGLHVCVVSGPQSGLVFALPLGVHEIGRGAPISWPDDMQLSRRHARLTVTAQEITVEDLGSSNGTFVDGVRVGRAASALSGRGGRLAPLGPRSA